MFFFSPVSAFFASLSKRFQLYFPILLCVPFFLGVFLVLGVSFGYILFLFLVALSYLFEDLSLARPVRQRSEGVCVGAGAVGEEMEEGKAIPRSLAFPLGGVESLPDFLRQSRTLPD